MTILRRPDNVDAELTGLFERSATNGQQVASLLRDLLKDYPEHAELVEDVKRCEHLGDRITRDIIHRLASGDEDASWPFGARDGHGLATALDDIVDEAEQTAVLLGIYGVEAPMEQAVSLAEVLVEATANVSLALAALCGGGALRDTLSEIHRLESDGDRLLRDGLAALFTTGIDPMVVIRWKDIFESLESAVDACQTVAHLVEGISLRDPSRDARRT